MSRLRRRMCSRCSAWPTRSSCSPPSSRSSRATRRRRSEQPPRAAVPASTAPASPPSAQPPPAPPTAPELKTAITAWPAVVEIVKQGNAMLAALLAGARPVEVSERELTLAFPADAAFLKRKAEQDDHRRVAAEAYRRVTGQPLVLRYELRDLEPATAEPAGEARLSGEELVRRFLEEFDAEEILDAHETEQREAN